MLVANAPGDIDRAYFVSGGSEATESAIKLARQYHVERGEPQRRHLIARNQSYHGNTLGALAAGGNEWRHEQFAPILIDVSHISPCYEYVGRLVGETAFNYGHRMAQELEDEILRLGTDSVMAFMTEPMVGATMCTKAIYETIENGSGFFQHGHTYLGHPVATAAGLAVVRALLDRDLIPRVSVMGEKLQSALVAKLGQHPHVGDIRGRGLFRGVELVAGRETKTPFDPSRKLAAKIKKAAFANGLICYPMSGTRDGKTGDHVLLAPPFILEDVHIDEIVEKLSTAIETALAS